MNTPRLLQLLALTAIAILSTNCIGTQTASLGAGTIAIPQPDASRNEALVCVYRKGIYGSGLVTDAYLDNKKFGALPTGKWTYILPQAGPHELKFTAPPTKLSQGIAEQSHVYYPSNNPLIIPNWKVDRNRFKLSPGDRKYFKIGLKIAGMTTNRVSVQEVSESKARREISRMSFSTISE